MTGLVTTMGIEEVELHFEGRTARLPRGQWPATWSLDPPPTRLLDAIEAWLLQQPMRDDLTIDVEAINALIE